MDVKRVILIEGNYTVMSQDSAREASMMAATHIMGRRVSILVLAIRHYIQPWLNLQHHSMRRKKLCGK